MPDMVLDSQRQMQAACFCGVFPEADLAWASVDNVLYIWDASRCSAVLSALTGLLFMLGCAQSLSETGLLQIVCAYQMARGAGHLLRWTDKAKTKCVPTGSPVHPSCVHYCRGGSTCPSINALR